MIEEQCVSAKIMFYGEIKDQLKLMNFYTDLIQREFDKSLTNISINIWDKSSKYWKQKFKSLKYTPKNIEKFQKILAEKHDKMEINFDVYKYLDNHKVVFKDFELRLYYYNVSQNIFSIDLLFSSSIYFSTNWFELANSFIQYLSQEGHQVLNGFVINLDYKKNPHFYLSGLGGGEMAVEEEQKVYKLSSQKRECDTKIWDVLWGNIISKKHIKSPEMINYIKVVVGDSNVIKLSEDLYWFNLNDNLYDFEILDYTPERKKLYDYFESLGLIWSDKGRKYSLML